MQIPCIQNVDVRGKYVLLREDFNVQIVDGKITDTFRIDSAMATIKYLVNNGARVAICSHLGRPDGVRDMGLSLRPIAEYMNVGFVGDCLDKSFMKSMSDGDVVLLENLRFYRGENENADSFAKQLSDGFDIYVNDAFAVSHRAAASVVGVVKYLPGYAGILMEGEIKNISRFMENATRPLVAFIGGGKVSNKIGVLKKLATICDKIVIGGAMGTTFNFSRGLPVGDSLCEKNMTDVAQEIIDIAKKNNCEIMLPLDKGVGKNFAPDAIRINRDADDIHDDDVIMDDGDKTIARNRDVLKTAKTVIWNGTFGLAEWGEVWGRASFDFARCLARLTKSADLESLVGGGDTVAALDWCGVGDDITYVSTGGGAFLEFVEGKNLPGIAALRDKN